MEAKDLKILKIGGIVLGVLTLGVVGIAVFGKKKEDETIKSGEGASLSEEKVSTSNVFQAGMNLFGMGATAVKGNAAGGTVYKIDNFDTKIDGGKDLILALASPRPVKGSLRANDKIKLSGLGIFDGTYRIPLSGGIWIDGSGNIGGISLNTGKATVKAENQKRAYAQIMKY